MKDDTEFEYAFQLVSAHGVECHVLITDNVRTYDHALTIKGDVTPRLLRRPKGTTEWSEWRP